MEHADGSSLSWSRGHRCFGRRSLLLLLFAGVFAFSLWYAWPGSLEHAEEPGIRFRWLRPCLNGQRVAGYLDDATQPRGGSAQADLYQANYTLAPVLIQPDMRCELVVLSFASDQDALAACRRTRLTIVSMRSGIGLARRGGPSEW